VAAIKNRCEKLLTNENEIIINIGEIGKVQWRLGGGVGALMPPTFAHQSGKKEPVSQSVSLASRRQGEQDPNFYN